MQDSVAHHHFTRDETKCVVVSLKKMLLGFIGKCGCQIQLGGIRCNGGFKHVSTGAS